MVFNGSGRSKSGSKNKESKEDGDNEGMDMDMDDSDEEEKKDGADGEEDDAVRQTLIRGPGLPSPCCWGSCVHLVDPSDASSTID